MSEKQLTAHDMELLTCAGIYVEPQTLNGPACAVAGRCL